MSIESILRAKDGTEFNVVGTNETWLVLRNPQYDDESGKLISNYEVKASPHGAQEDFDADCYWFPRTREEVEAALDGREVEGR